jgi:hypothetical protein
MKGVQGWLLKNLPPYIFLAEKVEGKNLMHLDKFSELSAFELNLLSK